MKQATNKKVDYLLVGQGIAGTILAHFLLESGCSVHVVDDANPRSSTAVAAGLINPITGRNFVKSWRVEEFLPVAVETYKSLEKKFNTKFYHPRNIVRAIFNAGEQNEWLAKSANPGYDRFVVEDAAKSIFENTVTDAYDFIEIAEGAKVDVGVIITKFREYFKSIHSYSEEKFDFEQLDINPESINYKNIEAEKIIFCEGADVKNNPYFNYLPFLGDKGEVLIVKVPGTGFEKILKHQVYLIPTGEKDTYWVGATMRREFPDNLPSEWGREFLLNKLEKVLTVPYEIIDHRAAVRPTVRDRRPFIGPHPANDRLFLFNGMGSKGTSLVPFWAKHTVDHFLKNSELDKEVNVKKYQRYYND